MKSNSSLFLSAFAFDSPFLSLETHYFPFTHKCPHGLKRKNKRPFETSEKSGREVGERILSWSRRPESTPSIFFERSFMSAKNTFAHVIPGWWRGSDRVSSDVVHLCDLLDSDEEMDSM